MRTQSSPSVLPRIPCSIRHIDVGLIIFSFLPLNNVEKKNKQTQHVGHQIAGHRLVHDGKEGILVFWREGLVQQDCPVRMVLASLGLSTPVCGLQGEPPVLCLLIGQRRVEALSWAIAWPFLWGCLAGKDRPNF